MMPTLLRVDAGDHVLGLVLVVTLAVVLVSSTAWLISRRLAGNAPLRHLVSFSALICCLSLPAAAWICAAADVVLISIPLFGDPRSVVASAPEWGKAEPAVHPPQHTPGLPHVAEAASSSHAAPPDDQAEDWVNPELEQASKPSSLPSPKPVPAGDQAASRPSLRELASGVMFVWFAGSLLMLVRLGWSCALVVRLRRSVRPAREVRLNARWREVTAQLEIAKLPLLLVSSRPVAPLAAGFGRPAVILPDRLVRVASDEVLWDVLLHELAHLQRRDQWIVLLQAIAGALYWPIVSVHALNRELQRAREDICDNVVLASRNAIQYGNTLLHVAELLVNVRPMGTAVGIIGRPSELERRIAGLVNPRRNTMTRTSRKSAWAVAVLFIAGGIITSVTQLAGSAPPDDVVEAAPPAPEPSPTDREDPGAAGSFSGQVTGPDGQPVRGARVYLVPNSGFRSVGLSQGGTVLLNPLESLGPVHDVTDADGRFALHAPDMTYTTLDGELARRQGLLMATADDFAPDWMTSWGNNSSSGSHWDPVKGADLYLQLSETGVPIRGRVLGPDGLPLAEASVRLSNIMIPERRDLAAHLAEVTSREGLFGVVDYARSLRQPGLIPELITETQTDAEGRFIFRGLGRDWLAELTVSEPSVETTTITVMTHDAPDVATYPGLNGTPQGVIYGADFTIQLEAGRTIRGRVVDRASGEPIEGMWVGPVQNSHVGVPARLYPWRTDEEGHFTITGLPPKLALGEVVMAIAPSGTAYQKTGAWIGGTREILIKSPRGIPFRMNVVDEEGRPVEAEVTYTELLPNPHVESLIPWGGQVEKRNWPNPPAARTADGAYQGFVLPGPGAVLVNLPRGAGYRPAYVHPKEFFAPGRTNWTEEQSWVYGTEDTLTTSDFERIEQSEYEAIVLVNPAPGADSLQLVATVVKDRPRHVNFVDASGEPVYDISWTPYGSRYHAHTLPLRGLHPDRIRSLTYFQEERGLIGTLLASGDGDSPYTVHMQPWATVTGSVVDESGRPLSGTRIAVQGDPIEADRHLGAKTDDEGRFTVGKLIPGHRYSGKIHRGNDNIRGRLIPRFAGMAFENLELRTGEVRDVGQIQAKPPTYEEFPLNYRKYADSEAEREN
ncbi:MAG: M56 family metallopeptidase [Pirellulales bacterium]